jgi:hypothetical protein
MNVKEKLKKVKLENNLAEKVIVDSLWSKFAVFIIGSGAMSIDDASKINEIIYKKYMDNNYVKVNMIARIGGIPDFIHYDFIRSEVTKRTMNGEISLIDFDDSIINAMNVKTNDMVTCVKVFNEAGEEKLSMYNAEVNLICSEIEKIVLE